MYKDALYKRETICLKKLPEYVTDYKKNNV